ncbi:MAG: diguanylate cyclase, partial [Termitinemataceae bacterium]
CRVCPQLLVQIQITERVPKTVMLDQNRLRQVLVNLMGNAIKFTDEGSVSLFIEAVPEYSAQEKLNGELRTAANRFHLIIEVTDTGIGISEEFRARLFDPFSQQDISIYRKYGGTGLGLAISKRLLDLMGGSIRCEAPEQGGTRFRIDIPQVPAAGAGTPLLITFGKGLEERMGTAGTVIVENVSDTNTTVVTGHVRGKTREIASDTGSDVLQPSDVSSLTILIVGESAERRRAIRRLLEPKKVRILETTITEANSYPVQQVNGILIDVFCRPELMTASKDLIKKWVTLYRTPLVALVPAKTHHEHRETLLGILGIGGLDYISEVSDSSITIDDEELWLRLMNQLELKGSRTRIAVVNRVLSETTSRLQQLSVQVDKLATLDDLTGLANRKTLWTWLVQELARCKEQGRSLAILISDIDHLKHINDVYGQQGGDRAVVECAHRFAEAFERKALTGRWSGEEFLAIIPDITDEPIEPLAEKVRQKLTQEPLHFGIASIQLSISIGVCCVTPYTQDDVDALASAVIRTAEDAVFRAKARGRNVVEILYVNHPDGLPILPTDGSSDLSTLR